MAKHGQLYCQAYHVKFWILGKHAWAYRSKILGGNKTKQFAPEASEKQLVSLGIRHGLVPSKNVKFLGGTLNIGVPYSPNSGGDVSPATPPLDKPMVLNL